MTKIRNIESLPLDGGLLCLDFVNTVQTRKRPSFFEYLPDYKTFLQWCLKVNILDLAETVEFEKLVSHSPETESSAYKKMMETRELLYAFFSQKAAGVPVDAGILDQFNTLLAEALSHIGLKNSDAGPAETWLNKNLNLPLWKIMRSAHDILIAPESKYVKECAACGWLFLDKSRTHTRRWCNPLECGSVDKATRYYHKMKAKKAD